MTQRRGATTHRSCGGRPAAPPASALAVFIVEQAQRLSISHAALAGRAHITPSALSRLLTGKTQWTRVAPQALADALELSVADRKRLFELCEPRLESRLRASQKSARPSSAAVAHVRKGRPPVEPTSPIGMLIEPLLRQRGMTRQELASALGVETSTVTRMMNGAHASSHTISAQQVSEALRLPSATRREFLRQAFAIGAFALTRREAPTLLRYQAFDLEGFDDEIGAAQRLLDQGEVARALERAKDLFANILGAPFPAPHQAAALRRIDAGLLLGAAQEAALPWGRERTIPATRTYNLIDEDILTRFPPRQLALQYARLYERRAPMYRELEDYAESIRQFTLAIDLFMPYVDDSGLLATLYRNRAHVWATQGNQRAWRNDLDRALGAASRVTGEMRARLEGLVLYSEAEGFKRLAGAAHDPAQRRALAESALASFATARTWTQHERPAHLLLLDVSAAQAMLMVDAPESLRQANAIRERADGVYPALAHKIELTIASAEAMLMTPMPRRLSSGRV